MAGPIQLNVRGASLSGLAAMQNGANRLMNQGADRIQQAIAGYGTSLNNAATGRINDAIGSLDPNLSQGDRTAQIAALKQNLGGMGGYNSKAVNEFQEKVNPFSLGNKLKATQGESAALTLKGQREQDATNTLNNNFAQSLSKYQNADGVLDEDAYQKDYFASKGATNAGYIQSMGNIEKRTGQDRINAANALRDERQFKTNLQREGLNSLQARTASINATKLGIANLNSKGKGKGKYGSYKIQNYGKDTAFDLEQSGYLPYTDMTEADREKVKGIYTLGQGAGLEKPLTTAVLNSITRRDSWSGDDIDYERGQRIIKDLQARIQAGEYQTDALDYLNNNADMYE